MKKVISVLNMRESDAFTIKKYVSSKDLMYKAALGVFNNVNWFGRVGIIAGSGNNAGDGYALSLILKEHGIQSKLLLVEERFSIDGEYYFSLAKDQGIEYELINEETNLDFDILVDCLFGTGFKGKPKEKYDYIINKINSSGKYVVSVDINSGLNGDNGLFVNAVKSNITVSIGQYKFGHYINQAKDCIGSLVNAEIGIEPLYEEALLLEDSDVKNYYPLRKNLSNKGSYGYVGIIGGSSKYPGAVKLASLGQNALYAGAGVSKVIVPSSIAPILYNSVLETTIYPLPCVNENMIFDKEELDKAIKGLKTISVGIGWGESEENEKILSYLLNSFEGILIIDADGLNVLSKMNLDILNQSKAKIVLTPHLKEFSRLCGNTISEIQENSISLVKEFVNKYNVTILLKGPTTIVASNRCMYLVDKGTPGMATAGSGDVLTGILTGVLGIRQDQVELGVAVGAYINGLAGERAASIYGEVGMVSSDTARSVSLVIKDILGK